MSRTWRQTAAGLCLCLLAGTAVAQSASFDPLARDGRAALDTGRLSEALVFFENAAAASPDRSGEILLDWAWTYVETGYLQLRAKDYENADKSFSKAAGMHPAVRDAIAPQWAFARIELFWIGFADAKANPADANWNAAVSFATKTVDLAPELPIAHYALGLAYEWGGDREKAKREYRAAIGGRGGSNQSTDGLRRAAYEATRGRRTYTRPLSPLRRESLPGDFETLDHGQFVIHHHNGNLGERAALALEYYLSKDVLYGFLEPDSALPCACEVYIHRDSEEFQAATGQAAWSTGFSKWQLTNGKATRLEIHLYQTASNMLDDAASHELTHVRFDAHPDFHDNVPMWVTEGIACSTNAPYKRREYAQRLVRTRDTGGLIPVGRIFAMQDVPRDDLYRITYAEAAAMVDSLVRLFGPQKLWEFIRAVETNDQAESLKKVYGLTIENLEDILLERIADHDEEESSTE